VREIRGAGGKREGRPYFSLGSRAYCYGDLPKNFSENDEIH